MTAYGAGYPWTFGTTALSMGVLAVSFPVKIARVEVWAGGIAYVTISKNTSASLSGGSTISSIPLRGGAPTATAVAKSGCTITGTSTFLTKFTAGNATGSGGSHDPIIYST